MQKLANDGAVAVLELTHERLGNVLFARATVWLDLVQLSAHERFESMRIGRPASGVARLPRLPPMLGRRDHPGQR